MKPELSQPTFEKILRYQISWKSVQWEPRCSVRTYGAGRQGEANSPLFAILRKAPKTLHTNVLVNNEICWNKISFGCSIPVYRNMQIWLLAKGQKRYTAFEYWPVGHSSKINELDFSITRQSFQNDVWLDGCVGERGRRRDACCAKQK